MSFVSRGFRRRRRDPDVDPSRVPPGQYVTDDFPVLSAGPTLREEDEPGFWETYGYHLYGDPWLEQRYAGD
jgi:DMSO/TMAO reductase YedYZ molybdopterin-dependent catalytic subunit